MAQWFWFELVQIGTKIGSDWPNFGWKWLGQKLELAIDCRKSVRNCFFFQLNGAVIFIWFWLKLDANSFDPPREIGRIKLVENWSGPKIGTESDREMNRNRIEKLKFDSIE